MDTGVGRQVSGVGGLLRPDARHLAPAAALLFAASFFLFAFFFLRMAILWDADSYYHLAVARHYVQHGLGAPIPWARFSLLGNGGDKELLFHILLMPFTVWMDAATGGRIALALLNAALFAAIGALAVRAIGAWGLAVPFWMWIAVPPFFARVVRLRPELVALLIIVVAIPVAARKSWIALGVLAMAFAYSYTAWEVFLALCVAWVIISCRLPVAGSQSGAGNREPGTGNNVSGFAEARAIALVVAGTAIGLFARPHPIAALRIWFVQNVLFFFERSRLDVGNEIGPPSWHTAIESLPFLIAIIALLAISRWQPASALRNAAIAPAILFLLLFLFMARMALYAFPLIAIAALFSVVPRKLPLILVVTLVLALPLAANPMLLRILRGAISEADWQAFGRAVPAGTKVAARWGDAEVYVFSAPQGRYLNVLDPVFMAVPYPRQYAAQRALFDGSDPDPAFTAKAVLDSDYLAFDWTDVPRALIARVKSDPRFRVPYGGYNVLLQIVPSQRFVTDANGRAFFDRSSQRCAGVSIDGLHGAFVFAPYGPSEIAVDGGAPLRSKGVGAILSLGTHVSVARRVDVRTCRAGAISGFYLMRLE